MSQTATQNEDTYAEWAVAAPVSRNFDVEVSVPSVGVGGRRFDFDARLKLRANTTVLGTHRECWLSIILPKQSVRPIVEELDRRGLWADARTPRYGSWRRYLLEVAKAHAVLEILGWELTKDEQALIDSLDAYAATCPAWVLARIAPEC